MQQKSAAASFFCVIHVRPRGEQNTHTPSKIICEFIFSPRVCFFFSFLLMLIRRSSSLTITTVSNMATLHSNALVLQR